MHWVNILEEEVLNIFASIFSCIIIMAYYLAVVFIASNIIVFIFRHSPRDVVSNKINCSNCGTMINDW